MIFLSLLYTYTAEVVELKNIDVIYNITASLIFEKF